MTDDTKLSLSSRLSSLDGVGEVLAKRLSSMGLNNIEDLIEYYPKRYYDCEYVTGINKLRPGMVVFKAKITDVKQRRVRRGLHITEAVAIDDNSSVKIIWFNQPYRAKSLQQNVIYLVNGEYGLQKERLQIVNPSVTILEAKGKELKQTTIIPEYKESKFINSSVINKLIKQVAPLIKRIPETLPTWIIKKYGLLSVGDALFNIHLPSSQKLLLEAKKRLAFEELFVLMMATQINSNIQYQISPNITFDAKLAQGFVNKLPFSLTDSQRSAIWQIYSDMSNEKIGSQATSPKPMNRLLEGDVGSGKTVVAAMASIMVANNRFQVAFAAPTELLAQQHYETFKKMYKGTDYESHLCLLTGNTKNKELIKRKILKGQKTVIIGTHALLQKDIEWNKLGLVIIDEQHRFGVEQRQQLLKSTKIMPHVLCLTATPIPRSLALTLYGELDISILTHMPKGRIPVITKNISPNSRPQIYEKAKLEIEKGRQLYIVCPIIAESETLQVANVENVYKELSKTCLKEFKIALLHGKLKTAQKEQVMQDFIDKKIDILVSTTLIEVGVDIPNASVMIIESADRFGLAQLHQLRGRVGRGIHQSFCYLIKSDSKVPSKRLKAIESTNDGFELAELDLEIRGPGSIYGLQQHGALDLRLASLTDVKMISQVKESVKEFSQSRQNLLEYKQIAQKVQKAVNLTYLN